MKPDEKKVFKTLNVKNIWLPVAIGIGIALYLFIGDGSFKLTHLYLIRKAHCVI